MAVDTPSVRLSTLLSALPQPAAPPGPDPDISAVTHDSRRVTPGALFVAVRGESVDGHQFMPDAIRRGAAAVVCERETGESTELKEMPVPSAALIPAVPCVSVPNSCEALAFLCAAIHGFPARRLVMIGITGTDGKTTTAALLHSILTTAGCKTGLVSTVNAVIGHEVIPTGLHTTTPDAPEVQGYLAKMVAAGMTHCIVEATSHGLAQHRVDACDFDVAVVTNITHEHLDYHGSIEAYFAAKARLFVGLAASARKPGQAKAAVLNTDDASYRYLTVRLTALAGTERQDAIRADPVGADTSVRTNTYGIEGPADITARNIQFSPAVTCFDVVGGGISFPVETTLVGRYNVSNCLAAIATAVQALHLSPEAARAGIAAVRGVPGRMERIDLGQPFAAIVDFAHTPNALARALGAARQMAGARGRVIAVFGSAGLRDRAKRRMMPEASAVLADLTILTAEDPRTESLDAILAEMAEACARAGGIEGRTFWRVPDRGEALRFAVSMAQPGDLVIACGKGHEQSMCFGAVEYAWDDRTAMRAALAESLAVAGPAMHRLPTSR